jgi:hypothetical protein
MTILRLSLVCLVLAGVAFLLPFDVAKAAASACFALFVLFFSAGLARENAAGATGLPRGLRAGPRAAARR